jgi:hypothetical protein
MRNKYTHADIIGKRFGRLSALKYHSKDFTNGYLYLCKCDCGKKTIVLRTSLISGNTKSCGCFHIEGIKSRTLNLTGKRYGRLIAVKWHSRGYRNCNMWLCKCDCGKNTIVSVGNLNSHAVLSYGCLRDDTSGERWRWSKNPSFNPTLTDEDRLNLRSGAKIAVWSSSIKKRDNYTCKVCEKISGNLVSHHLDAWHWCKTKRHNVDNGVTLCVKCHKQFHKEYGRHNNTYDQFWKFKDYFLFAV